jgi:hypothetical protein
MARPRRSPVKWWPCLDKKALTVTVHTECGNCGATLMGPYCFDCGQHKHESARSVSALFEDAWHAATHVDGYFPTNMLFGSFTCTPTLGLSTSCVMATFPAMLTS